MSIDNSINEEYLRHFTTVGDRHTITATEDILGNNGVKVLAAGHKINSALLQKLLQHKLLKPIDQSCVVEDAIDSHFLHSRASALLDRKQELAQLFQRETEGNFLHSCFGYLELPTAICNKLTVLKEQAPGMIDHSLWCTMSAVFIGQKLGMNQVELKHLASAALLHDIGELHIDHRILEQEAPLDAALRRQVRSHPVIGSSIVAALDVYDDAVSQAILEHHERADGSGYPRGVRKDEMSQAGRVLSFVEFSQGILDSAGARHLDIVTRTYAHQFDAVITRIFWEHLNFDEPLKKYPFNTAESPILYARLLGILESWEAVEAQASASTWAFARRDFRAIRSAFSKVGLSQALVEELSTEAGEKNSEAHLEVCSVLREGLRQAREATEILNAASGSDPEMLKDTAVMAWLEDATQALAR